MIDEYEIDYSETPLQLKHVNSYEFNEDMTDIGMVALFFMEFLKADEAKNERIYAVAYDNKDRLIGIYKIANGDFASVIVDRKKLITFLLLSGASQFIVEHNHPNGNSTPSQGDKFVDGTLSTIGITFGLKYLGSLVVGNGEYSIINGDERVEI